MAKAPLEIRSLARGHTELCIRTLAAIVAQPKAADSARVAAARELLDRGWGKAESTMNVVRHDNVTQLSDEDLAARIVALMPDKRDTDKTLN